MEEGTAAWKENEGGKGWDGMGWVLGSKRLFFFFKRGGRGIGEERDSWRWGDWRDWREGGKEDEKPYLPTYLPKKKRRDFF